MKAGELARLRAENQQLRRVIYEIHWMARRYATGRRSYAPSMFNDAIRVAINMGCDIRPDVADNDKIYADYGPDMIEHKATAKGGDQ
jgi:hypothetical protein